MGFYLDIFLPPFGLLLLGALLRRLLLPQEAVWAGIERLVFWALMPALLVSGIAAVDVSALPLGRMGLAIWLSLLCGAALSLGLARLFRADHPATTSVFQGGIRFNNLMGFALAGSVLGAGGTGFGAVATGLIVPFVQTLTTLVFAMGPGQGGRFSARRVLRQLLLNPLLLACIGGFLVSGLLGGLPHGLRPLLQALGQASVALGLLCVGAALSLGALGGRLPLQLATSLLKLLVMPAIALGFGTWLELDPLPLATAVVFMALPTATTSYVMARAMGGDAPLMAALTSLEHLLSVLTLPCWILLLQALVLPGGP
ncbi:AEC family transporter [Belnapia sp. T6]|uniref:AEC family transporter n=1 Tax=Belnapia mucosa TaxID=2804532 RepID=A0ABS1V924_9PROT|nr:AEC family transporter [Belnapia mucosa]MBL6458148.1 AEC family transporter [Belnapia mucosa]